MDETKRIHKIEKIAHALGLCLIQYFREVSRDEQGIKLNVVETSRTPTDDGKACTSEFLLSQLDGVTPLNVSANVSGGKGNVYNVILAVEGKQQEYTVSVPDDVLDSGEFTPDRIQSFFGDLCHGLLYEVERVTGKKTLRQATEKSQE